MADHRRVGVVFEVDQSTTDVSIAKGSLGVESLEVDLTLRQPRLHKCLDY